MKLLDDLGKYPVFRKLLFSYIMVVIITVITISTFLFRMFSESSIKEIDNISRTSLTQVSYASSTINEQVFALCFQLLNDSDFINLISGRDDDKLLNFRVMRKLQDIQGIYPFILYISIYSGSKGSYYNTKGIETTLDNDINNFIKKSTGSRHFEVYPRKVTTFMKDTINVLTFTFHTEFARYKLPEGAIVVNIREDYLEQNIARLKTSSDDILMIVDPEGKVLCHTDRNMFMKDLSKEDFILHINGSDKKSGNFIQNISNTKYLITYVRSDIFNWCFISLKPYNLVLSNIMHLRNITLLLALSIVAAGILLAIPVTRNIYNPLQRLINKLIPHEGASIKSIGNINEYTIISNIFNEILDKEKDLESSLHSVLPTVRDVYLKHLIKGNSDKTSVAQNIAQQMENEFNSRYYRAIILIIDNYKAFIGNNSEKEQDLLMFSLCNITRELLNREYKSEAIPFSDDHAVAFCCMDTVMVPQILLNLLNDIQKYFKSYFDISISISIGNEVGNLKDISNSYKTAVGYICYRLYYGHACILYQEKLIHHVGRTCEYPYGLEEKILEAVQLNNRGNASEAVDAFSELIQNINYNTAIVYLNQLLISLYKLHDKLALDAMASIPDTAGCGRIDNQFSDFELLSDISEYIKNYCNNLIDLIELRRSNKNNEIIRDICDYISKNYSNPQLSREYLAEYAHISPGYLGRLFKTYMNVPLTDYINGIRLEKAMEFLENTDITTAEICSRVGLFNNSYFFTLFKKTYGITPSEYRKKHHTHKSV